MIHVRDAIVMILFLAVFGFVAAVVAGEVRDARLKAPQIGAQR